MSQSIGLPEGEPSIVMEDVLDAPRALVWKVFTTPEHIVRWYGGRGFVNRVLELDLRPGGHWRMTMAPPEVAELALHFVFVEVTAPRLLSWQTLAHGVRGEGQPQPLNTLALAEAGPRRTRLTFTARFSTLAERDAMMQLGYTRVLGEGSARMAALLEELKQLAADETTT